MLYIYYTYVILIIYLAISMHAQQYWLMPLSQIFYYMNCMYVYVYISFIQFLPFKKI